VVSFSVRAFLKYWLPVLAWMIFIFVGSTDFLSAAHTSRFIGPFLRWFSPEISDATIGSIQLIVRKCGHLTEYAILAALLSRALPQSAPWIAFFSRRALRGRRRIPSVLRHFPNRLALGRRGRLHRRSHRLGDLSSNDKSKIEIRRSKIQKWA
jgi:hypothetical protein